MLKHTWLVALFSTLALGCLGNEAGLISGNGGGADGGTQTQNCRDADKSMFYLDGDGDGYGDPNTNQSACVAPQGYVSDNTDCDDLQGTAYPGATEMCGDKIDNDCDGTDPCLPNLMAQWTFEDVVGPNTVDYSGRGHTGVLMGGLDHQPGATIAFDGVDDYVEVPTSLEFQLASGTIGFWFMPLAIGQEQSMLSKDSSGNDAGGHLSFYVQADGLVRVRLQSNNDSFDVLSAAPVLAAQWTHVAFAWGGTEGMKLYVNGALVGTNPYTGGMQRNEEPLVIGAGTDNSGNLTATPISKAFAGQMADVELFDRKLLLEEIQGLRTVNRPAGATL